MATQRWNGTAYVGLVKQARWDGAVWVDLTIKRRWDGTAWVDLSASSAPFNATVSSGTAYGASGDASLIEPVVSETVIVTAVGGSGAGPTITWARVSGSPAVSADSPTGFTTSFSGLVPRGVTRAAVFSATVSRGVDSVVLYVNVELEHPDLSGI